LAKVKRIFSLNTDLSSFYPYSQPLNILLKFETANPKISLFILDCSLIYDVVLLRCVPSLSTKTVRLELLPLTDGIITLDTLQIAAKERGM
jgi:hypothetical protein